MIDAPAIESVLRCKRFAIASASAAERVAAGLRAQMREHGEASLIVPGGRTPMDFFRHLGEEPIEWAKLSVCLSDERWVSATHSDSNTRLVRPFFAQEFQAGCRWIDLYTDMETPHAGRLQAKANLAAMRRPFGAVVLGMGEDGHFASLFPGAEGLSAALDPDHPEPIFATLSPAPGRISLTLSALTNAAAVIVLISGEQKWEVAARAAAGDKNLPIHALFHQSRAPVHIIWGQS